MAGAIAGKALSRSMTSSQPRSYDDYLELLEPGSPMVPETTTASYSGDNGVVGASYPNSLLSPSLKTLW